MAEDKDITKINKGRKKSRFIYQAIVKIKDDKNLGRLKVQIVDGDDDFINNEELPWCNPFFDRAFTNLPKVGEVVNVIMSDPYSKYSDRFWVTRKFSEFSNISEDYGIQSAMKGSIHSKLSPKAENIKDLFPDSFYEDLWILGRQNSDVIFGQESLEFRVAKHLRDKPLEKNTQNPSKVKLYTDKEFQSYVGVLADKILLLSNKNEIKPNIEFDEERIKRQINNLYSIPRGEELIDILNVMIDAIINHNHKYHFLSANIEEESIIRLKNTNLNNLNNKNIKTN